MIVYNEFWLTNLLNEIERVYTGWNVFNVFKSQAFNEKKPVCHMLNSLPRYGNFMCTFWIVF